MLQRGLRLVPVLTLGALLAGCATANGPAPQSTRESCACGNGWLDQTFLRFISHANDVIIYGYGIVAQTIKNSLRSR